MHHLVNWRVKSSLRKSVGAPYRFPIGVVGLEALESARGSGFGGHPGAAAFVGLAADTGTERGLLGFGPVPLHLGVL